MPQQLSFCIHTWSTGEKQQDHTPLLCPLNVPNKLPSDTCHNYKQMVNATTTKSTSQWNPVWKWSQHETKSAITLAVLSCDSLTTSLSLGETSNELMSWKKEKEGGGERERERDRNRKTKRERGRNKTGSESRGSKRQGREKRTGREGRRDV